MSVVNAQAQLDKIKQLPPFSDQNIQMSRELIEQGE